MQQQIAEKDEFQRDRVEYETALSEAYQKHSELKRKVRGVLTPKLYLYVAPMRIKCFKNIIFPYSHSLFLLFFPLLQYEDAVLEAASFSTAQYQRDKIQHRLGEAISKIRHYEARIRNCRPCFRYENISHARKNMSLFFLCPFVRITL